MRLSLFTSRWSSFFFCSSRACSRFHAAVFSNATPETWTQIPFVFNRLQRQTDGCYATNLQSKNHLDHVGVSGNTPVEVEHSEEHQISEHHNKGHQVAFAKRESMVLLRAQMWCFYLSTNLGCTRSTHAVPKANEAKQCRLWSPETMTTTMTPKVVDTNLRCSSLAILRT